MSLLCSISTLYQHFCKTSATLFTDISALFMRLLLAKVFLSSGLLKWNGWFDFNEQQYDLFLYEFFCPDPAHKGALQLCNPETLEYQDGSLTVKIVEWFALSAGILEIILPMLLILGIFTRIGALGLIGMTLFIQLAIFPEWSHWWNPAAWWLAVALAILARGPGRFSLDYALGLDKSGVRK
jgi:putative oxidoreductase